METPPNAACCARLPWPLRWFFLLAAVPQTISAAPTPAPPAAFNATLLLAGGAPGFNLRSCSCAAPVRDCDEALANALCRCRTVVRSALPPAGLREAGQLSIWVKEVWLLEELLSTSRVHHLHLSFCGLKPVDSRFLALAGVQTLRITAPGAPYPRQEVTISPSDVEAVSSNSSSSSRLTLLDAALFNGLSAMKAYTVVGPPASALAQHFPHLPLPRTPPSQPAAAGQNLLVTFVY